MTQFKDDKYEIVEVDIEKIQTKPSQYIGTLGSEGSLHLSKEAINNAIDECINKNSPGKVVDIFFDELKNEISVSDQGRGIPFDIMIQVCTILQSSTKFTREQGSASAGENGTGIKASNALSAEFEVKSFRLGECKTILFKEGKLIDEKIEKCAKSKHGTTFRFIPSKLFLGKNNTINYEDLKQWLYKIHFLCPKELSINLSAILRGKNTIVTKTFKNKSGIEGYLRDTVKLDKVTSAISYMGGTTKVYEEVLRRDEGKMRREEVGRTISVEFTMCMVKDLEDKVEDSFCNFVNTTEHGVHYDAVRKTTISYLREATSATINKKDSKRSEERRVGKEC